MNSKLFGRTNPNDLVFKIETQEGSDILEGDEGLASIGDSTMEHIQALSPLKRMAYDEFIHMPDGNIFRSEDNPRWDDPDEFNLRSKSELDRFLMRNKIPESLRHIYEEAVEKVATDEESEDVMDHPEELIPYSDWEKYGGQSKYWDIPATPKPKLVFSGNSKQAFYDDFAEDHPLATFINRVLNTLDGFEWYKILLSEEIDSYNRNTLKPIFHPEDNPSHLWTDGVSEFLIADEYVESVRKQMLSIKGSIAHRLNVYENLKDMILKIGDGKNNDEPRDVAVECLVKIDRSFFDSYKKEVVSKTKDQDPLFIYLCELGNRSIQLSKKGKNGLHELNKFGKTLFETGFATDKLVDVNKGTGNPSKFENQTVLETPRRHHWAKYKAIKAELERIHGNRMSRKASSTATECMERIRVAFNDALEARNLRRFTSIATDFMQAQKSGKLDLSGVDRNRVWAYYNQAKKDLVDMLEDIKAGIVEEPTPKEIMNG